MIRMKSAFKACVSLAALVGLGGVASAQQYGQPIGDEIVLYDGQYFSGDARIVQGPVNTLVHAGFNDRSSSVEVRGYAGWLLCQDISYDGPCLVVRESIPELEAFGLGDEVTSIRPLSPDNPYPHGTVYGQDWQGELVFYELNRYGQLDALTPYDSWGYGYGNGYQTGRYGDYGRYGRYGYYDPFSSYNYPYGYRTSRGYRREQDNDWSGYRGSRNADVVLYRDPNFRGSAYGVKRDVFDLSDLRFNDEISSIEIKSGTWEICSDAEFRGRCQIVDASSTSLKDIRLNDNISSIRRVSPHRSGPARPGDGGGRGNWGGRDRDHDQDRGRTPPRDRDGDRGRYERGSSAQDGRPQRSPGTILGRRTDPNAPELAGGPDRDRSEISRNPVPGARIPVTDGRRPWEQRGDRDRSGQASSDRPDRGSSTRQGERPQPRWGGRDLSDRPARAVPEPKVDRFPPVKRDLGQKALKARSQTPPEAPRAAQPQRPAERGGRDRWGQTRNAAPPPAPKVEPKPQTPIAKPRPNRQNSDKPDRGRRYGIEREEKR